MARGIAEAAGLPLLLLHVVEPIRAAPTAQARVVRVDAERRHRADAELDKAVMNLPASIRSEGLVAYGEPAEEIVKVALDRDAGMIVMGLHSSPVQGARMGSVTYRVLCLAHRLVLGVPPEMPTG
jgi:nucleotide-binding universal stress UspA family protein